MAKNKPVLPLNDKEGTISLVPDTRALDRTVDSSISTATDVTMNAATKLIEVQAVNAGVFLKYDSGVTSGNFDEHIQADTMRHYVLPEGVTTISVLEDAASATVYVIEK